MSAIAGIVQREPGPDNSGLVRSMCALMVHRGPHGIEILSDGPAYLGQCTLRYGMAESETRLCGPARPGAGGLIVVWDGEIFNRRELERLLGLGGDAPAAEILGACYRKWGADCARHLDGQFALAIWDARRRTLYLARDRLGEKPLYYHHSTGGDLVFASEIKAVLRDARVPRDIDHRAVYFYLFEKVFRLDETPLSAVRLLPPGHWMSCRDGRLETRQYWDVPLILEKIADEDRVLSTCRELLLDAVGERVAASRLPAILLSGGIDSCLLVGAAARARERLMTVILVSGAHAQQVDLARSVARRFGTEHVEITLDSAQLRDGLDDFAWSLSKPTVGSICNYFCSRAAAERGADTVMTGQLADSIFAADWHVLYANLLDKIFAPFALLPERRRIAIYDHFEKALRGYLGRTAGFRRHLVKLYLYFRRKRGLPFSYGSGLYPDQIFDMFEPDVADPAWGSPADLYRLFYCASGSRKLDERFGYSVLKTSQGENALLNHESVGGTFGLRLYDPFGDQQLIEFSRAIPQEIRGKGAAGKYINRVLCEQLAGCEYAAQRKEPFSLPLFTHWLRVELAPLVADTLSPDSLRRRGFLRPEAIGKLVERFRGGDPALGWSDLYAFVVLEIWLRLHVDPPAERLARPASAGGTAPVGGPVS